MDSLQTELDKLSDQRLDYVMARSRVNSDSRGHKDAGVSHASFYLWPANEREHLNALAQRVKRENAFRAMRILQEAVEEAAKVKVSGLKSRDERVKQGVATEIIDRIAGKAPDKVELTVDRILVTLVGEDD
jgi:hypothetical protein